MFYNKKDCCLRLLPDCSLFYFDAFYSPEFRIIIHQRMLERADFVITYITHITGGAADFKALAERKGKTVINLDVRC